MYIKKLKIIIPFVLLFSILTSLIIIYILPPLNIKKTNYIEFKDSKGNIFFQELNNKDGIYVELDKINDNVKRCFIGIEDKNFYSHLGLDFARIIKATLTNIEHQEIKQGASTITQQLAKNLYFNNEKSFIRKIKETFAALRIESDYSKDEIFEAYLNNLYFGHGIYGIENAAQYFFDTSSAFLSLAQSALLTGIVNSPSIYSPFVNREKSIEKQTEILNYLYNNNFISLKELELAKEEKLIFKKQLNHLNKSVKLFYVDLVKNELKKLNIANKNGLVIETYYDELLNNHIQDLMSSLTFSNSNSNISICIMEPYSNKVLCAIGGKDYYKNSFNCVYMSNRQIGSTIKPFIYYVGLKKGMTILSNLDSSPTEFYIKGFGNYKPKNNNNLYANKDINMIEALAYSDNIYAIKTGLLVGSSSIEKLFNSFDLEYSPIPSSFLGSVTYSPLELASLYNCLASEGIYYKPTTIKSIKDTKGNILYKNNNQGQRKLDKDYSIILNQLLTATSDVNLKGYTSPSLINYKLNGAFAVKTGSTFSDNWVIGYNPEYTICVWMGNQMGLEFNEPGLAKNMFKNIANVVSSSSWYSPTNNIIKKKIDPNTGLESSNGSIYYFLKEWDL